VESYSYLVGPYLDGRSPYWPSPLDDVVLSSLHVVRMASDRAEGTVVPSVLAGSVRCAYSCQSGWACLAGLDLSPFPLGVGTEERSWGVARHAVKAEGRGRG
jgi:hypothetical protein